MRRIGLALVAAMMLGASPTRADDYPSRPIKIVLPFSAGGGTDVMTRVIAERMQARLGQRVLVDNITGAGGNIGTERVAHAAPDGYTLLLATMSVVSINPALYADLPFDVARDFVPVSVLLDTGQIVVVNPATPYRSLQDLVAAARARPDTISFASAGVGTSTHLYGELFKHLAGVQMTHVPYRGNGPALADVISGQVQVMFDQVPNSAEHVKGGRVRALAVTTDMRLAFAPDVPTAAEAGMPGLRGTSWAGMMAPRATPPAVTARLNAVLVELLAEPATQARLDALGAVARSSTPDEFGALIQTELAKWKTVVAAAKLTAN